MRGFLRFLLVSSFGNSVSIFLVFFYWFRFESVRFLVFGGNGFGVCVLGFDS